MIHFKESKEHLPEVENNNNGILGFLFPILRLYECIPQTWNVLPIVLLCIQNVEMGFFERPYFVQTDNRRKKAQKLFRFKDFDLVAVMFFLL